MGSRVIIALCALLLGWGLIAGFAYVAEQAGQRSQELALANVAAEAAEPFEVKAVESVQTVAIAGFAANTAIAASGDLAQASMTRSFATAIIGIGIIIAALAYIISRVSKNNNTIQYGISPYYTTQNELSEHHHQDR